MFESKKFRTVFYKINLVILFLFFLQFLDFPNKLTLVWATFSCLFFMGIQKTLKWNWRDILLVLGMLLYAVLSKKSWNATVSITLLPVLLALLGRGMTASALEGDRKQLGVEMLVLILIVGYYLHGFLNSILYLYREELFRTRHWSDIWTGGSLPATQHNLFFLPIFALLIPVLLYQSCRLWKRIVTVLLVSYAIIFSFLSSSRIPLMVFALMIGWGFVFYFITNRKNENIVKRVKYVVFIVGLGAILGILVWIFNVGDIQNSRFASVMARDGGILGNIRFRAQISVLKQLFVYPMGGYQMQMEGLSYAHNVWLDIANAAGIIPFSLFLAYTIVSFRDMMVMLKNNTISTFHRSVLSGLYFVFVLYYMVEPALEANVQYLLPWTFLNGLIYVYGIKEKGRENERYITECSDSGIQ